MVNTPPIIPPINTAATGTAAIGQQPHPPPLPRINAGVIVQGTVAGHDANGHLIIESTTLKLVISTQYPVAKGAQVAVRLEHPIQGTHIQESARQVSIVTVEGRTPLPAARSPITPASGASPATTALATGNASAAPTAPAVQPARAAAELAKPVGLLMEVVNRSGARAVAAEQVSGQASAQASGQTPASATRPAALEVNLSNDMRLNAMLLRPAILESAAQLLGQLAAQHQLSLPLPSAALRPGLQLLVQLMPHLAQSPMASAVPQGAATRGEIPGAVTPLSGGAGGAPHGGAAPVASGGVASAAGQSVISPPSGAGSGAGSGGGATAQTMGVTPPSASMQATPSAAQVAGGAATADADGAATAHQSSGLSLLTSAARNAYQRLVGAAPPAGQPALSPALVQAEGAGMPAGTMAAVVVGREQSGSLVVQTRLGTFSLPASPAISGLQPGAVVTWQVQGITLPPVPDSAATVDIRSALARASQLTGEWSALRELTTLASSLSAPVAAQIYQRVIPQIGSQLGAGLLFFMAALRKGDVGSWLGRDVTAELERIGKGGLVQRLGADFAAVRNLFTEAQSGGWQALFFPLMVEKELTQAQMFVKQDEQDRQGGGVGTRFIVDLDLSALGAMQLDGFIKKHDGHTQFDLVIRTTGELPDGVKTDIYAIFTSAQEATGMQGGLHFRLVQELPQHPLQEIQARSQGAGEGGGSIIA